MTSCDLSGIDPATANLHCHTPFCDGRSTMLESALSAVEAGITTLGFTPHSPVPIPSPCNMRMDDVATYLAEIDRLRSHFGPRLRILAGMEIDYLGEDWGPSHPYFSTLPLDFAIGSVHFIPALDGTLIDVDGRFASFREKMALHFNNDIGYVTRTYFERMREMISRGGFSIVGHIDKIARNASLFSPGIEDSPEFIAAVNSLIDLAVSRGMAIEVNTKIADETGRTFPRRPYLARLAALGARVFVNSDTHLASLIDSGRPSTLAALATLSALRR